MIQIDNNEYYDNNDDRLLPRKKKRKPFIQKKSPILKHATVKARPCFNKSFIKRESHFITFADNDLARLLAHANTRATCRRRSG